MAETKKEPNGDIPKIYKRLESLDGSASDADSRLDDLESFKTSFDSSYGPEIDFFKNTLSYAYEVELQKKEDKSGRRDKLPSNKLTDFIFADIEDHIIADITNLIGNNKSTGTIADVNKEGVTAGISDRTSNKTITPLGLVSGAQMRNGTHNVSDAQSGTMPKIVIPTTAANAAIIPVLGTGTLQSVSDGSLFIPVLKATAASGKTTYGFEYKKLLRLDVIATENSNDLRSTGVLVQAPSKSVRQDTNAHFLNQNGVWQKLADLTPVNDNAFTLESVSYYLSPSKLPTITVRFKNGTVPESSNYKVLLEFISISSCSACKRVVISSLDISNGSAYTLSGDNATVGGAANSPYLYLGNDSYPAKPTKTVSSGSQSTTVAATVCDLNIKIINGKEVIREYNIFHGSVVANNGSGIEWIY